MEHNPYAPTAASLDSASPAPPGEAALRIAPRWRRYVNGTVDAVIYTIVLMGIEIGTVLVYPPSVHIFEGSVAGYLFGTTIVVVYYFTSEALFGRTLGKLVTHTTVVSTSGGPPTPSQILRRTLVRLIPFEAFTFMARKRAGWHDRFSETRVVLLD